MARYQRYTLRRTNSRTVYAIYDELAIQPVCRRDGSAITSTDATKVDRLAAALNAARDAATVAGAMITFGTTQSDAWRYAQTTFGIGEAAEHRG